ncbi:FK506-binding protein 5, partial [Rhizopus stolonifer]
KYLVPAKAKLRFEVELIGFWEKPGSAAERLRSAEKKKMEGNELFKAGATNQALFAYRKAREYIKDMWNCEPEELEEARHIMVAVQLNIGACYLKLKNYDFAIEVCKKALERDATKIKAYYRLGQAYMEKDEYDVSISYIKLGLEQRTKDQSLLTLLNTVEKKQQKWINNSTSLYRKMFNTPQEDI